MAIGRVQDEWGIFWNLLQGLLERSAHVKVLPSTEISMFSMFIEHTLNDIVEGCLIYMDPQMVDIPQFGWEMRGDVLSSCFGHCSSHSSDSH
jgi:hypothetical protein